MVAVRSAVRLVSAVYRTSFLKYGKPTPTPAGGNSVSLKILVLPATPMWISIRACTWLPTGKFT
jgi:hypothetical protein